MEQKNPPLRTRQGIIALALLLFSSLVPALADPAEYFPFGPSDPFDLSNSSVLFTPDGNGGYDVCIDAAFNYPVSPNTHTVIALGDDDSRTVPLTGRQVLLFGTSYSVVNIGSNGYLTLGSGNADSAIRSTLAGHYIVPRVSALAMDLAPNANGTTSHQELADRFVVTFQDVQQFGEPSRLNSFQYELFFDGRIRITWLAIGSPQAEIVVGLSGGGGVPGGFAETDFSAAPPCTLPNNLSVLPLGPMLSKGFPHGTKFTPLTKTYTLENVGAGALDWSASTDEAWASLAPGSGTLLPGETVALVVTLDNPALGALPAGLNSALLTVNNVTASAAEQRGLHVHSGCVDHLSESFGFENPFDLGGQTVVFTPDASPDGYSTLRQPAASLPTDPYGGNDLNLTTGTPSREVRLCGGRTLPFFGIGYDRLFVNNHGNLTFGSPDGTPSSSAADHFSLPRISALFGGIAYAEFAPGTLISWKELADRVAVTWEQNTLTFGPVSAQAELFYDGVIRLTWIGNYPGNTVAGLSRGAGLPADFGINVSDLGGYGQCPESDALSAAPDNHLWKVAGPPKGPFLPGDHFFTLGNADPVEDLSFRITADQPWLVVGQHSGRIPASGNLAVGVSIDQAAAAQLPSGTHIATLAIDNVATGRRLLRGVCLRIDHTEYFTEVFDDDFDLAFKSMTFTPNGSRDFYDVCLEDIVALPENNFGHAQVPFATSVVAQQSKKVSLAGGKRVWLYGTSFSELNVSNHGWVKFGNVAMDKTLGAHFSHPAISVCRSLFEEFQHPDAKITAHQDDAAGKLTITWQDLAMPANGDFNNFQLEMFYDGRIRMSWLGMDLARGDISKIVGLSRGRGHAAFSVPPDFFESDLNTLAVPLKVCGPGEYFARGSVGDAASFAPASAVYELVNSGSQPIDWSASVGGTFLEVSPSGGTLAANTSVTLTLAPHPTNASGLPEGWHRDALLVEDRTNGCSTVREATLIAGTQDEFFAQEWFPTAQGVFAEACVPLHPLAPDHAEPVLDGTTITLVPDGSANFYSVARTTGVTDFPTPETAGVPLEQESVVYKLSGNHTVQLYGKHYSEFRRAWESGALTFNTMVDEPVQSDEFFISASTLDRFMVPALEEHVAQPGIAPLLATLQLRLDETGIPGGQIEARELPDRAVLTWIDADNFAIGYNFDRCWATDIDNSDGTSNRLQIELFFNGTIRYTILNASVDIGRNFNLVSGISGGELVSAGAAVSPTSFELLPAPAPGELDWGDLGGNYRTLGVADGPRHAIVPLLQLGSVAPDAEPDGNPSSAASGDDSDAASDDEDGLLTNLVLERGQAASMQVAVMNELASAQDAELSVFIDWNGDGNFDDTDEEVGRSVVSPGVGQQVEVVPFTVPAGAALLADLGLRLRLSTQFGLGASGAAADGEVEDYLVQVGPPAALDFGDLPSGYATTRAQDGARHIASADLFVGATAPDAENDGAPSALADGDGSDENTAFTWTPLFGQGSGVVITSVLFDVTNNTTETAYVTSFLDFSRDGDFADAGESPVEQAVAPGTHTVGFLYHLPVSAYPQAGAFEVAHRVRLSTRSGLGATGFAPDGEVEDHLVNLGTVSGFSQDWGDLPESGSPSYATTAANGGPFHEDLGSLRLGSNLDANPGESDGQPSADATGDDANGTDDEDGVTIASGIMPGSSASFGVVATNRTGAPAFVYAFVDWNADGDFDAPGESKWLNLPDGKIDDQLSFVFDVPSSAQPGLVGARFRVSPLPDLGPTGDGFIGEVEDFLVPIEAAPQPQFDWGDLPAPFATSLADNGPRHQLGSNIYLGSTPPDEESDGEASAAADADDGSGTDDEDKDDVVLPATILPDSTVTINVKVTSQPAAFLLCCIDFDGNGEFDQETECFIYGTPLDSDNDSLAIELPTPPVITSGPIAMRLRLTTDPGVGPFGLAPDGEVEDHVFFPQVFGPEIEVRGKGVTIADGDTTPDAADDTDFGQSGLNWGLFRTFTIHNTGADPLDVTLIDLAPGSSADVGLVNAAPRVIACGGSSDFSVFIAAPSVGVRNATVQVHSDDLDEPLYDFAITGEVIDPGEDWGDLGPPYPTLVVENGPRHVLIPGLQLGQGSDPDTDGQPTAEADGDTDDGIFLFPEAIVPGTMVTFGYHAQNQQASGDGAHLQVFIDWNGDGQFAVEEKQTFLVPDGSSANSDSFFDIVVPLNAAPESSVGMRLRLCTDAGLGAVGSAPNGEVEDYMIVVESSTGSALDFGDLPDELSNPGGLAYQTRLPLGPSHVIDENLNIGGPADAEADGQPTPGADGDDLDAVLDDEDGVTIPPRIFAGAPVDFQVQTHNNLSPNAQLSAFVDWNGDGQFTGAEIFRASVPLGGNTIHATFLVPSDAETSKPVGARFRLSTDPNLPDTGPASDGEVEDYMVQVVPLLDFGDLPDAAPGTAPGQFGATGLALPVPDYRTTLADDGPRHRILIGDDPNNPGTPTALLTIAADGFGTPADTNIDAEFDGQPHPLAQGDDAGAGTDDEGGIETRVIAINAPSDVHLQTNSAVFNATGADAYLAAFIDTNLDGDFDDPGEAAPEERVPSASSPQTVFCDFTVPFRHTAEGVHVFPVRLRLSPDPGLGPDGVLPGGDIPFGEVEDHVVSFDISYPAATDIDFGDLADKSPSTGGGDYQSTLLHGGPSHSIVGGLHLGSDIDFDGGFNQDTFAEADDRFQPLLFDDEDGVILPTAILAGQPVTFTAEATNLSGGDAFLHAFADWNGDGDFDDAGEVAATQLVPDGTSAQQIAIGFTPPANAQLGRDLGVRIRLSSFAILGPDAPGGGGEVEDYVVRVGGDMDFGDLPESGPIRYATSLAKHGPSHLFRVGLHLGDIAPDVEPDGSPTANADGDVNGASDDEDGLVAVPASFKEGQVVSFTVRATNHEPDTAELSVFVDWNGDGDFSDPDEAAPVVAVPDNSGAIDYIVSATVTGASAAAGGLVGLRLRLSTDNGLTALGGAADGEVEDYLLPIPVDVGPEVSLVGDVPQVLEPGGVATISATLPQAVGNTVVVDLEFPPLPGVADPVNDYVMSAVQIVIPAGQLSAAVTLTAIDDTLVESWIEPALIRILNVTGARRSATQDEVNVEIVDDDNPVFQRLQNQHGLSGLDASPTGDPDGDGHPSVEELAIGGGDPAAPHSTLQLFAFGTEDPGTLESHLHLLYQRRVAGAEVNGAYEADEIRYEPRGSIDLEVWEFPLEPQPIPATIPGSGTALPAPEEGFEWVCYRLPFPLSLVPRSFVRIDFSPAG